MVSIFLWLVRAYVPSLEMFLQNSPNLILSTKPQSESARYSSRISHATESAVKEAMSSLDVSVKRGAFYAEGPKQVS